MFSIDELRFASKFPFSATSRQVLKLNGFELNRVPAQVLKKAVLLIVFAQKPHKKAEYEKFFSERQIGSSDLLLTDVQAFPVAKILLSAMNQPEFFDRFADLFARQTFFYLSLESNKETLLGLANEMNSKAHPSSKQGFFAQVALTDFLEANFREDFMKLVNQQLDSGTIFLNRNDFCRFLSELSRERVASSLPVSLENVPKNFVDVSRQLKEQLAFRKRQEFDFKSLGSVDQDAFPPCMAKIYSELLAGQNVNHPGRFNLATFLVAIGMPTDQIVDAFKGAPNFDEKVTRYQVERIAGHGKAKYSPSSCAKMREYELCVANCPVTHPLQFYRNQKQGAKTADAQSASE
ncbi:MAG: hypothetical protein J4215_00800 [Candidatus Diapherotrites archaeon]|uniref:DNA primase large subunit PriL n=1 Tax=Candidatus Iainarchaeum sp. TaxID=3101447 RepID=A0A8T4L2W1_9ARCH|nr:hypothetical protein [Candidatus Diapherotrites archaeon]